MLKYSNIAQEVEVDVAAFKMLRKYWLNRLQNKLKAKSLRNRKRYFPGCLGHPHYSGQNFEPPP